MLGNLSVADRGWSLGLVALGFAVLLAGALNFYGQGIAGWLLLVSVLMVTLAVSMAANRLRSP